MRLNQFYNEIRDRRGGVLVRCAAGVKHHNQPQDMWLKPGMDLLCSCKTHNRLVNGVFYTVEAVDKKRVVVRMHKRYHCERTKPNGEPIGDKEAQRADQLEGPIDLSHRDASLALRLSHCLCYASTQGLTIDKRVVMFDLEHRHFSVRSLIVGISRVTNGKLVHAATKQREDDMMARTREVPKPTKVVEELESSDSESDDE
jgi:hypothetical protein